MVDWIEAAIGGSPEESCLITDAQMDDLHLSRLVGLHATVFAGQETSVPEWLENSCAVGPTAKELWCLLREKPLHADELRRFLKFDEVEWRQISPSLEQLRRANLVFQQIGGALWAKEVV